MNTPADKPKYTPPPCTRCGKAMDDCHPYDDYMLSRTTWAIVHPEGYKGLLCHTCLEQRAKAAGHTFTAADFVPCLCYLNRHIQPTEITVFHFRRNGKQEILHSIALGQVRRIIKEGLPMLPDFLYSIRSVGL